MSLWGLFEKSVSAVVTTAITPVRMVVEPISTDLKVDPFESLGKSIDKVATDLEDATDEFLDIF